MRRARHSRGLTLLEILVVTAIMGMLSAAALISVRNVGRSSLRSQAFQMAAAIRYCYDRAVTTNGYYRLVLDFDSNTYWAERSNERVLLGREKEKSPGKGQALDVDALEKERDGKVAEEEAEMRSRGQGLGIALEPPPRAKRAKFATFSDAAIKQVKLKQARLMDAYTPRQQEPYKKGKAYLYFFPDGHTERALIHMADQDAEQYFTLRVSPLTGQVTVHTGEETVDKTFDEQGLLKGQVPSK
jgi:general secretion pathway protein H